MPDHPYPPPRQPLSSQPLPDLPELIRPGGPDIAPAPGALTGPFRDPRFAALAKAAGLHEADLRRAERVIQPLTPEELAVVGFLTSAPGLLDPILPAESLTLLHGPRGVGLTHLAVGMAVAMATGTPFLGWEPPRPSRVLLVSGTMSATTLAARIEHNRRPLDVEIGDRLHLVGIGRKAAVLPDLATEEGWQELGVLAATAEVVIVDDIAGLLPGGRLNAAAAAGLQQCLVNLRRDGKVVVVAQADEPEARRGARAVLQRLADVEIRLARPAGYEIADGCRFELHIDRARHLGGMDRLAREVRLEEDDAGDYLWHVAPAGAASRTVFEALMRDGVPVRAAGHEAGISQATAYRWCKQMRTAEAAAAKDEKEKNRDRLTWTMRQALAEYEEARRSVAGRQLRENENPPRTATVPSVDSPSASHAGENEKPTAATPTRAAAETGARTDENENPSAASMAPKLNRHMRRKLARLERRAGRGSGAQPDRLAA